MAKLSLVSADPSTLPCDLLLVPTFETDVAGDQKRLAALLAVDKALDGLLLKTAAEEEFAGRADQGFVFLTQEKASARRVMLLGLGKRQKFDPEVLRLALGRGAKAALRLKAGKVVVAMPEVREVDACIKAAAEALLLGSYRFDRYKGKEKKPKAEIKEVRFCLPDGVQRTAELQAALELGEKVAEATNLARDLVNEPASALTPATLAEAARKVAREKKLKVEIHGPEGIEKLGMGMLLAVARGSALPPTLIKLSYTPAGKHARRAPLAFVGKGLTYDSGGLSLKPTESMAEMKNDLAGAAAVIAAMRVIAELKPPFPVHAYVGACENMPGGRAFKVGDVLHSRSGKTVEVMNTDAEGRLVLGDVLDWACESKPSLLVDLATLTGACVVALGHYTTGAFGADDTTVWEVLEAAKSAGEPMWRMPFVEELRDGLKSEIADLKNVGERWGGAVTAALFLREFVGETPWVHLDIAGPAMSGKERGYFAKGATGVGVRTLVDLVRDRIRDDELKG
jgi:leucyl aminopeptidase